MSTLIIYNDTAEFYLPDCETIRNYLARFAGEDYEADDIQYKTMVDIYDNLTLLFGYRRMSRRERNALCYNLEHIDGQLRGLKYSQNTKGWITTNMPTLERDEDFCSTEILTDLYSFYKTLRHIVKRFGRRMTDTFSVTTTDVI